MKDILLVFCLWCCIALYSVVTRPINGLDIPALLYDKVSVDYLVEHLPSNSAVGFIDGTFGKRTSNLARLLSSGNVAVVRVHFFNGSGLRMGVSQKYEMTFGQSIDSWNSQILRKNTIILNYLKRRTAKYKKLFSRFPHVIPMLSPEVEHNLTPEAFRILANTILDVWPGVQLVNSAEDGNGERYRGALRESHTLESGAHVRIASMDGLIDIDPRHWFQKNYLKLIRYYWTPAFNCRKKNETRFVAPRSRAAEDCPTNEDYEAGIKYIH